MDNGEKKKTYNKIEMVKCSELFPGGKYSEFNNNPQFPYEVFLRDADPEKFNCPIRLDALPIRGKYGDRKFEFIRILLEGCDLGPDECIQDDNISNQVFNFLQVSTQPNILTRHVEQEVHYSTDERNFFYLDPTHRQSTNIYFMENTIRLKEKVWDIYDFTEKDV